MNQIELLFVGIVNDVGEKMHLAHLAPTLLGFRCPLFPVVFL